MTTAAIVTMVLICGIVWGGFVALLARAIFKEGKKRSAGAAGGR